MSEHKFGFRTRALHAGGTPDATTGARAVPIYQSTSFIFDDAKDAANLFALQKYGNIYSRIGNPTVAALEERIASLEGGIGAVATASGMAAEYITFSALAGSGDHIVASSQLYGGTVTLLDVTLRRMGIETTFVESDDPEEFRKAIRENTKAVYTEVISNPGGEVADLEGLSEVAHTAGVPLVVDATLATPYLLRPIEHGADIVIHSVTKFLGGHGTTLGGVVVEAGTFDWGNGRFPTMTEPVKSYGGIRWWDNFGEYGFLTKLRSEQLRDIGPSLNPQAAFTLLQGVETLPQRMDAHIANARIVAEWLASDPRISYVTWAGLDDHPHFERAQKYFPLGPGSVFAFGARPSGAFDSDEARRGTGDGREAHRVAAARQPPRERRRCAHARAAPRDDHAPAAQPGTARCRGCAGRSHPHLGGPGGPRRHHLGSRPGTRSGDRGIPMTASTLCSVPTQTGGVR